MHPNSHPNDYHNSASTTTSGQKTSNRSSDANPNTQSTNGAAPAGFPELVPPTGGSQLPDTQGSRNFFTHRFTLSPQLLPRHVTNHVPNSEVHYVSSQPSNSDPSQSSQPQKPMAPPPHTSTIGAILNDEEAKPQLLLDEEQVATFHQKLVTSTSGCSLEQLEQINASLMDAIWTHRHDYNRTKVLHRVSDAFNLVINDIATMQQILKASQESPEPEIGTQYMSTQEPGRSRQTGFMQPSDEGYSGVTQY